MHRAVVLQYRRANKRLQIILLPWSANLTVAALLRFHDETVRSAEANWRVLPSDGIQITLAIDETERFVADAAVEKVLQSQWINHGARLELRGYVDLDMGDLSDIRNVRPVVALFKRIPTEVDNWV